MRRPKTSFCKRLSASASAVALGLIIAGTAVAQTNTATVRGTIAGATGGEVVARNASTGFTTRVPIGPNGAYVLTGLPPGSYTLTAPGPDGAPQSRAIVIGVGQNLRFDFAQPVAGAPGAAIDEPEAPAPVGEEIVITGTQLIETRTSEVATNITTEQIRTLPQTDRNFLSFASLAPGVRYNDSETDKGFTSGASTASQVNVFIDGQSLKNNVLAGGVAGQQNSRGNPFPQLGVQEFRVLTQNYKAEYEQAAAAIITAVTKSGTNEFHGEAIGAYTDERLSETEEFVRRDGDPEPEFKRVQYGGALGGPIIRDNLFFFFTYEGNDQDRAFIVNSSGSPERIAAFEAASGRTLSEFEGAFGSPFRADLYFGKITFQPDDQNTIDVSYSRRDETDIQGFGGNTAFEFAENRINTVDTYNARHTLRGQGFVNELSVDYVDYNFNPTSLFPDLPTFDYDGVIVFGGRDATRDVQQRTFTFRNDLSLTDFELAGSHLFKFGVKYAAQEYEFTDARNPQPRFFFRIDPDNDLDFSFPGRALLGFGDPNVREDNYQIGIYAQDDWDVTDRLTLNIGVRWDYEQNQFNNDYVTPPAARALLLALPETEYFRGEDFINDGNDRQSFTGAIQPRVGFSYDISGDQSTVVFGGYGRYYDRNAFNNARDETYRLQYTVAQFFFSRDGERRDGQPTIVWDPQYLTREGLLELQAQGVVGLPELFAVKNDARPPRTDQFSLGVRQRFGSFLASVTGSHIRGANGFTNLFATRLPNGNCCDPELIDLARSFGFSNVLIGVDELDTRYLGLYVQLQKPYTVRSGYGLDIAYTLSEAEQNGNDLFSLDQPEPDDYGFRTRPGTERHVLVISGLVDLPWGLRFSTLSTFGSGRAFQVFDASEGNDADEVEIRSLFPEGNCLGGIFASCEVNLTLEKRFELFGDHELGLAVDLFNAFNNDNFGGFPDRIGPGETGEDFSSVERATNTFTLPRRFQFRAFYRF